ncbi:MAG: flagellar hook-basal body protein [Leptospirales bacterium]
MIRGLYTGASGMEAMQHKMNVVSNNLANVDKTAYKKDTVVFKTFPEMLIHRTNDDGVGWTPMGSFDQSPVVGKLGTGVEVNEVFTRFTQGALKRTTQQSDIALNGDGFMVVQTNRGAKLTRSGAFILNKDGFLVTPDGFPVLGENGPIKVARNNYRITETGEVWINDVIGNDPSNIHGLDKNKWENPVLLDTLQIRNVENPRHLNKEGNSFYGTTPESGEPYRPDSDKMPQIYQGFLEASNVNLVREMVNMIEVQRSFEMNQKAISTHDSMLGTLISQVPK